MSLGHETQIDYQAYIEDQADIGRRDDFEHYQRHKSPSNPCEAERSPVHCCARRGVIAGCNGLWFRSASIQWNVADGIIEHVRKEGSA